MPYKETYAHAFVTAQKSSVTALESRDIPLIYMNFGTLTIQNLFEHPVVNPKSLSKNPPWASSPFEILTVRSSAVSFGQKKTFSEILNFYDTTHLVHKLEEGQFFFSSTLQLLEVGDATSWIFFSSMGLDFIGLKVVKRWFSRGGGLHRPV